MKQSRDTFWIRTAGVFLAMATFVGCAAANDAKLDAVLALMTEWKRSHPAVSMRTVLTSPTFEIEEIYLTDGNTWKTVNKMRRPVKVSSVLFPSSRTNELLVYLPSIDKTVVQNDPAITAFSNALDWRVGLSREHLALHRCRATLLNPAPPYRIEFVALETAPAGSTNSASGESTHVLTIDDSGKPIHLTITMAEDRLDGPIMFLTFDKPEIQEQMARVKVSEEVDNKLNYSTALERLVAKEFGLKLED